MKGLEPEGMESSSEAAEMKDMKRHSKRGSKRGGRRKARRKGGRK